MLRQKLQDDQIAALKSGDKTRLNVLRFILAQIKNKEIDKKSDLNDEEVLIVLRKVIKELKESVEAFEKGERKELAEDSKKQLEFASVYLPKEISDEELKTEIEKVIKENQAVFDNNQKAIIGICMKQLKSKADPGRIMKILQTFLS
ncbi:MAG: GatB/YqeY domain-containing protein [Candidatus Roizmanbacteria bacterium]|nr:GatB/YqeY domain-containing protein [Candidatus Roizmanbacteria bacterium]